MCVKRACTRFARLVRAYAGGPGEGAVGSVRGFRQGVPSGERVGDEDKIEKQLASPHQYVPTGFPCERSRYARDK